MFKLIINLHFSFFSLESSPTSEIEFVMDKLGGEKNQNQDVEGGTKPKKTRRRQLLNHIFDIIAIAASEFNKKINY